MRILSILLIAAIALSPIHAAKKTPKLAKDSYHQLCVDLNDNITKPGKSLTRAQKKAVQTYLKARTISKLKKSDLKHFENALKKHRYIKLNKSIRPFTKNLKAWPEKSAVGKWYQLLKPTKGGSDKKINNSSQGYQDEDNGQTN